jgi:hypothetical protein
MKKVLVKRYDTGVSDPGSKSWYFSDHKLNVKMSVVSWDDTSATSESKWQDSPD